MFNYAIMVCLQEVQDELATVKKAMIIDIYDVGIIELIIKKN